MNFKQLKWEHNKNPDGVEWWDAMTPIGEFTIRKGEEYDEEDPNSFYWNFWLGLPLEGFTFFHEKTNNGMPVAVESKEIHTNEKVELSLESAKERAAREYDRFLRRLLEA